ncbi:MAG: FAD-dependent oxidoreductase [Thermoanaerobaculia bacterium]
MTDTANNLPRTTDVLIVGAGPIGLALATTLARRGVDHLVVDRLASGQNSSRAAVLHAHTLDVLSSLDGVTERMAAEGLRLARFSLRDRDRILTRLRFDGLPSRHSMLLMLPQDRTEAILVDALVAAGGRVHRPYAAESFEEIEGGVRVSLAGGGGPEVVRAKWVVGADGMHSLVRQRAGIGFTGTTYEQSFVLADVEMDWAHGEDEVMLFFSPAGLVVVAPLPGHRFRIVATLDEAPEHPDVADMQRLVDLRGPRTVPSVVRQVHWSSRFRLHHRVADSYRRGPFLIVGDAAHVHSPAGGQGMNTGLVDACVLGQLLADVLADRRPASDIDLYESLRRPAAQEVLALADRLTRMATMRRSVPRILRNLALRAIDLVPQARERLVANLSGLARREAAELPALEERRSATPPTIAVQPGSHA